jgi:diguanylate cyclase (GGDEF)-like protein
LTVFSDENAFFDNELLHLLRRIAEDISFALDGFDQEALRQAAESRANYLAQHDILTGLQRRNVLEDAMVAQHARCITENGSYALCLIDLDHFKVINDSYGHGVGDEVLIHVSKILRESVRSGDWVGRWGGEEFLCLLPEASPDSALRSMERIRQQLADTPVVLAGRELRVTASIGVVFFPADGVVIADLMARVDTALYQAKQEGGNCVRQAGLSPSIFLIGGQIEEALGDQRVLAAAQLIVSLHDRAIVADESLARMRLPDGQVLDAAQFVGAAADLGQLHRIDQAVMGHTLHRWLERLAAKRPPILHFVNVSAGLVAHAEELSGLLENIKAQGQIAGLSQECAIPFVIKITERAVFRDRNVIKRHLVPFLECGFRIALDNFGSGYSSLLYLADFPISFLNIEKQLIAHVTTDVRVAAIVRNIAILSRDLGIITVAEGIENVETAEALCDLGVDWGQGYYFARPVLSPTYT